MAEISKRHTLVIDGNKKVSITWRRGLFPLREKK